MKILLIGYTKLSYMPFINFYMKQIGNAKNKIHIAYWNRDLRDEISVPSGVILHEFKLYQEDEVSKITKLMSFYKYRKNLIKLLLHENYDIVIVLSTILGVLLYNILRKYYMKKYILDYRDVTFENISVYKIIVHKLVRDSIVTFVSSDAFRGYLPKLKNIYNSHNVLSDSLNFREIRRHSERKLEPIRIRYWGLIRNEELNKTIMKRFCNDERFELHYHGREQKTARNLKKYCKQIESNNIFFHGEYIPIDRYGFAAETELLHNLYDNKNTIPAMGNKFYDGIIFYIPQLCYKGSYMGMQAGESEVGLECDPQDEKFANQIYVFYNQIEWKVFEERCDIKLETILKEYQFGTKIINRIATN